MFPGYLGELCAVHKGDRPTIVRILDRICAVSDVQTCDEVHVDASNFSVNPSFSCRVVVSTFVYFCVSLSFFVCVRVLRPP